MELPAIAYLLRLSHSAATTFCFRDGMRWLDRVRRHSAGETQSESARRKSQASSTLHLIKHMSMLHVT